MDLSISAGLVLLICTAVASDKSLLNEKVMTIIDISSQLVKVKERITIVNQQSEPAPGYLYIVDTSRKNNLAYIEAVDDRGNSLHVNKVATNDSSIRFEISFHNSLSPDKTDTIDVHTVFVNCLHSYPNSVKQYEKHWVVFAFNVYYYSLYFTDLQTLVLNAGPIDVNTLDGEIYRLANNSSNNGMQYGPFYDMKSEAVYHISIHYETNSPFLAVEILERFIRISHWGFIKVCDEVSLKHTGPKLTGPFERLAGNNKQDTRIESFVASLPPHAFDIYLKDEIGHIYSFNLHHNPDSVDVHIRPRFVLYGGWKTQLEIGYSLPIKYYVSFDIINHNLYNLFIPLVNKLYPNMNIRKAKLNVILPEGATYKDINPYYELENTTKKKHCYVVDVICREVVSFELQNLVDHHSTNNFQLTYSFSEMHLLTKPLVLSAFIYIFFVMLVTYARLTSSSSCTSERNRPDTIRITQSKQTTMASPNKQEETVQIVKKEGKQKKKLSKSRMKSKRR